MQEIGGLIHVLSKKISAYKFSLLELLLTLMTFPAFATFSNKVEIFTFFIAVTFITSLSTEYLVNHKFKHSDKLLRYKGWMFLGIVIYTVAMFVLIQIFF